MVSARDREYDRFGPWVVEISDEDPPPARFEPYLTRTETPTLSLKIPRRIERRRARPGMDLYDAMVNLYADDLELLERRGTAVVTQRVAYRDVLALRVSEDLLAGRIRLTTRERPIELTYSTVSSELMARAVAHLRERFVAPHRMADPPADVEIPPAALSFWFERRLRAERASDPRVRAIGHQPEVAVRDSEGGLLRRALYGLVDKRLLEVLWLSDGRELKVIDRGATYAYRWQAVYGHRIDYLPLANLTAATWRDEAGGRRRTLELSTAGGSTGWTLTADAATLPALQSALAATVARAGAGAGQPSRTSRSP
jgi:hypothetical protein